MFVETDNHIVATATESALRSLRSVLFVFLLPPSLLVSACPVVVFVKLQAVSETIAVYLGEKFKLNTQNCNLISVLRLDISKPLKF